MQCPDGHFRATQIRSAFWALHDRDGPAAATKLADTRELGGDRLPVKFDKAQKERARIATRLARSRSVPWQITYVAKVALTDPFGERPSRLPPSRTAALNFALAAVCREQRGAQPAAGAVMSGIPD